MSEVEPKLEMTRLGSYAIVRKLAKGGMAEIFLARSSGPEGFEKLVVLKKILPKYAENPRFVQLFLDEAKLAASLDHPHIVQVYDMGRVDGNYFFTMEHVHGQDVRSILRKASRSKHSLPIAIAVQIARTMASALHHAHERKRPDGTSRDVVHRDVSPSNILVSYDGAIKLADFGVAKAASSTVRTRTGALKGKVGYMSPEQARGASIDRRSDIFSLGVVLWELVAMRRLFKSDNDLATIQAIINTPPPSLGDFREDCPPELDRIARRALEKDPAARYQTAQQVQRDLDELGRELKLDQSSIALSHFMNELFDTEIAAWREAQSTGITVTDFVVAHSSPNSTTPVSESDLSLEDSEEEDEDSGPEVDEEPSESAALPPQQPRSGMISRDDGDDATDFGPPPTMDSIAQLAASVTPVVAPPRPLASTIPRVKPPVVARDNEDNPFDMATTRLRPNPIVPGEPNLFNEVPTSVASPIFTDEAPTVQAPPDVLQRAFTETAETVQSARRYTDPDPAEFPAGDLPTPTSSLPFLKAKTTLFAKPTSTAPYPMQSPSVHVSPQTPPVGVLAMPEAPTTPMDIARPAMLGGPGPDSSPLGPNVPGDLMSGAGGPNPAGNPGGPSGDPFGDPNVPDDPNPFDDSSVRTMPTDPMPGGGSSLPGGPMPGGGTNMPGPMSGTGSLPNMYGQPMSGTGSLPNMHGQPMPGTGSLPNLPRHGYPGIPGHPNTPAVGVPAMPHGYPGIPDGYPGIPADLNIDLSPRRHWVIIAGVAVVVAVLAIVLVVVLGGGSADEDEEPPDPAPGTTKSGATDEPSPQPDMGSTEAKPAVKPATGSAAESGSGSTKAAAGSGSGSGSAESKIETAAPLTGSATEPAVTPPPPKIKKQPPLRRPPPKRR